jgi:hypothetical protein
MIIPPVVPEKWRLGNKVVDWFARRYPRTSKVLGRVIASTLAILIAGFLLIAIWNNLKR